ncbi:SMI1/KNR4 family protein [Streptosporangium sandarakinum]|uniref:Cell wall assembly regulator SMI1 n=1 Tax=Streptosporangium sandarakinum TaxID=1260955 RepID=A0A852USA8_9ACTN|nr:SMI1/KNR4 family protein [Streptosporangium sandarakinum]NYF38880.1 cell wall assembly regulator SMI1 [Streptosporangium sandarakinum]
MLRLITSRWVRLGLAAAAAAVIVVVIMRLRGRPAAPAAGPRPVSAPAPVSPPAPGPGPKSEGRWPPVPILGVPTADVLRHYESRTRLPRFLTAERPPRRPLDGPARRRLTRWGAVAAALVLLAAGAQALESGVFSGGAGARAVHAEKDRAQDVPDCEPGWGGVVTCTTLEESSADSFENPGGLEDDPAARAEATGDPYPAETGSPDGQGESAGPYGNSGVPDADCRPGTARPRVRAVPPRVTRAVNRQWTRIERWLRKNAPKTYETLAGPGRARTIAVAEAQMGLRFPNDLRASLLRHDGTVAAGRAWPFGPLDNGLMSVRGIRDTWRMLCGIDDTDDTADPSDPRSEWWDGRMIPFGADGSGDHLVADSLIRDIGEHDHEGSLGFEPGGVPVRSYYALLKATADALETGGTVGYWKPLAADGELRWDVQDS